MSGGYFVEPVVHEPQWLSVASNGLSGTLVEAISDQYFCVRTRKVASTFSTLGGNAVLRTARQNATELILHLVPR